MSEILPRGAGAPSWQQRREAPPDSALAQAGVAVRHHASAELTLHEIGHVTLARLQALEDSAQLHAAFEACEVPLPARVNACAGQDPAALGLAPREWLLFSEFLNFSRLTKQLEPALESRERILTDQSFGFTVFRIGGGAAPWLLQKHCGLDLCGNLPGERFCARTRLDHAAAILHYHQPRSGAGPFTFDLIVDRSVARSLWQRLLASTAHARELFLDHGNPR